MTIDAPGDRALRFLFEHADIRELVRQGLDKLRREAGELREALSHTPDDEGAEEDAPGE